MLTKQGTISSASMQNTVTVIVHRHVRHPLYKKSFRKSKKFLADTNGMTDLAVGDEVLIEECAPISRRKHFKLKEVIKRVPRVSEMTEEASGLGSAVRKKKEDKEAKEERKHEAESAAATTDSPPQS